jgi:hypothetical protein
MGEVVVAPELEAEFDEEDDPDVLSKCTPMSGWGDKEDVGDGFERAL